MKLTRYQRENAIFKIDGYDTKTPTESRKESFERAKAECLQNLRNEVAHVESINYQESQS